MAGRQLIVSDPDPQKLEVLQKKFDVQTTARNLEAVEAAGFVFINVLPQVVQQILKELTSQKISKDKVIISLAAGIPMKTYTDLGDNLPVVRALPNPPSQIGKGIAALAFNPHVNATQQKDIKALEKDVENRRDEANTLRGEISEKDWEIQNLEKSIVGLVKTFNK